MFGYISTDFVFQIIKSLQSYYTSVLVCCLLSSNLLCMSSSPLCWFHFVMQVFQVVIFVRCISCDVCFNSLCLHFRPLRYVFILVHFFMFKLVVFVFKFVVLMILIVAFSCSINCLCFVLFCCISVLGGCVCVLCYNEYLFSNQL